jgi:hypothetical protein
MQNRMTNNKLYGKDGDSLEGQALTACGEERHYKHCAGNKLGEVITKNGAGCRE